MTYTEQQIRDLSGRDLLVAFCRVVEGDDLTANTEERIEQATSSIVNGMNPYCPNLKERLQGWRAEPRQGLSMLDYLVPTLMQGDGWDAPLMNADITCVGSVFQVYRWHPRYDCIAEASDMATALLRAACIVRLREGTND